MIVTDSRLAYLCFREKFRTDVEEFWALALSPGKLVLGTEMLARGTVDACFLHPRDVFRFALQKNASSLIVAHNHPSGELVPSSADLRITRQLLSAGRVLQIPILDHLIVTPEGFASLSDEGYFRTGRAGFLNQFAGTARTLKKSPIDFSSN